MDKSAMIHEAERFMRDNVPGSRLTEDGSDASYLRHVLRPVRAGARLKTPISFDANLLA